MIIFPLLPHISLGSERGDFNGIFPKVKRNQDESGDYG
jgi:hypothetical protein